MNVKQVTIPNMNCHHCLRTIQQELGGLPGVAPVTGDPERKLITVRWDSPATWDSIAAVLTDIGFPPQP